MPKLKLTENWCSSACYLSLLSFFINIDVFSCCLLFHVTFFYFCMYSISYLTHLAKCSSVFQWVDLLSLVFWRYADTKFAFRQCSRAFWLIYHLLHSSWANWSKSKFLLNGPVVELVYMQYTCSAYLIAML